MRLKFLNDENSEYNNKTYIVDGVGDKIKLIEDTYTEQNDNPDYHTIERGSLDGNRWSHSNRWVHRSVLDKINVASMSTNTASKYKMFDRKKAYVNGDFVVYNDNIYMCSVNMTNVGAFEYSDWKYITQVRLNHAEYPIICFNKNIELYNHGKHFITNIDYVLDLKSSEINGKSKTHINMI